MTRLAWGILVGLVGCGSSPASRIEASWLGADTGAFVGAARADWCAAGQRLEIMAAQGDSGLALVLYPADTVPVGDYAVVSPTASAPRRPRASLAARWFTAREVLGYRATGGTVTVTRRLDGGLEGHFSARLEALQGRDTLRLTGTLHGLVPQPSERACPASGVVPDSGAGREGDIGVGYTP